jgi:hypothetical protein
MEASFNEYIFQTNELIVQHAVNYYFSEIDGTDNEFDVSIKHFPTWSREKFEKHWFYTEILGNLFTLWQTQHRTGENFLFSENFRIILKNTEHHVEELGRYTHALYLEDPQEFQVANHWDEMYLQDRHYHQSNHETTDVMFLIMHYAHIFAHKFLNIDDFLEQIELEKGNVFLK